MTGAGPGGPRFEDRALIPCADPDGRYFLPWRYKDSLPAFLFGQPTEPLTKRLIAEQVGDADILHAGAYVGDFLPALSRALPPGRRVLACEPNPPSADAAALCVAVNGLDNVVLHRCALGREAGTLPLTVAAADRQSLAQTARIARAGAGEGGATIDIEVRAIDALCAGAEIGVLHLDLEGYEFEALQGAARVLSRPTVLVVIENYQKRVVERLLAEFLCVGEADNNFFFARGRLLGPCARLVEARWRLREDDPAGAGALLAQARAEGADPALCGEAELLLLERTGDPETVARAARALVEAHPGRIEPLTTLSRHLGRLAPEPALLDTLARALEHSGHPNAAYAWLKGTMAARQAGARPDLEAAAAVARGFSAAFPRHPELALAHSWLAEALGETAEAHTAMAAACALRPNRPEFAARLEALARRRGAA